jgi:hypothetical protein
MQEPNYDVTLTPRPEKDLAGSVIHRLSGRSEWLPLLPEMLLLCNEASRRCVPRLSDAAESLFRVP